MAGLYPDVSINYTTLHCYKCGLPFGVPDYRVAELRRSHEGFWCPNGHEQFFSGKSDVEKLKEQLDAKERQLGQQTIRIETLRNDRDHHERCATRLRKKLERVKKGVCPCCNRTFQNLWEHMLVKHPSYKP
jgi:hypothetical protein